MLAMTEDDPLTPRERAVYDLLTLGLSSKEIGRALGISHRTVHRHRASIFTKKGVRNAVQLVRSVLGGTEK